MSQRYLGGIITANPTAPTLTSASGVWTTEQQFQNIANWPKSTGLVSRSVRLRSSASAYFNRTPAGVGNQQKFTWSAWLKRGSLGTLMQLFSAGTTSPVTNFAFYLNASGGGASAVDALELYSQAASTANGYYTSQQVLRDPSAWYHIVLSVDTTQATAGNRVSVWVNNQIVTLTGVTVFAQNTNTVVNSVTPHKIAASVANNQTVDGYLTEINFIDGQALTPSYFGFTDGNGVWQPATYSGTYGTNGFYLNFSDNSGVTATTIGKDYSGNGNNWTPNNISVTAGVTYDSMLDVPTPYADGGNGRGNYAVLNPLGLPPSGYSAGTFASGNLQFTTGGVKMAKTTMPFPTSGKWYVECRSSGTSASIDWIYGLTGMDAATPVNHSNPGVNLYISDTAYWLANASTLFTQAGAISSSDVFQIAYDADTGKVYLGKNNTYYNSAGSGTGNPSAGTNQFATLSTSTSFCAYTGGNSSTTTSSINFGQQPFTYTPPTGFVALNTQNLPTPTISNGATVMAATTYTGTGATQTISNAVNGVSFQPDFVWVKGRSGATDNAWYDAVRGVQKQLESNTTTAETTETTGLTTFGTTGFTIGALAQMNTNAATYVAWQWNAGGSTVTNTSGTISAQVRANATAGFSVVTYVGQTSGTATIGHGLGVAPSMIIVRSYNNVSAWYTYFITIGPSGWLDLASTGAAVTGNSAAFGGVSPTSTVFTYGSGLINQGNVVAYCFAAVAGYSAFGSYTGNGSTDGPFVFTGFRPRWVMIRNPAIVANWLIFDSSRDTYNPEVLFVFANTSDAEQNSSASVALDFVSNGFKIRQTSGNINASGNALIYMAFAENPFKLSRAR